MQLKKNSFLILFFLLFISHVAHAQRFQRFSYATFEVSSNQNFGFDAYENEFWKNEYDEILYGRLKGYQIPFKSVGKGQKDEVVLRFINSRKVIPDSLVFEIDGKATDISFKTDDSLVFVLDLPEKSRDYQLKIFYKDAHFASLNVKVYDPKSERVILVPMQDIGLSVPLMTDRINRIFRQANLSVELFLAPTFHYSPIHDTIKLDNPSPKNDRYTRQMQDIRDAYFEKFPFADKKAYYIFIVPGFVNPMVRGYMVKNKAIGFVSRNDSLLSLNIARQLGHGIGILEDSWRDHGPPIFSTENLMDQYTGSHLRYSQWENLRNATHSFSYYDNYENVKTNNGSVAYYFWEEDENGNIILRKQDFLQNIYHPYKKNFLSYHLQIDNPLFTILFRIKSLRFTLLHVFFAGLLLIAVYIVRFRFIRYLKKRYYKPVLMVLFTKIGIYTSAILLGIQTYKIIDKELDRFVVREGKVIELNKISLKKAIDFIRMNKNPRASYENKMCTEVLVRNKDGWHMKKYRPVLYFKAVVDENGNVLNCSYSKDSEYLRLANLGLRTQALSHYMVVSFVDKEGSLLRQRVYNHTGSDITSKIRLEDPSKRILVMVNGYRPISSGRGFEENFEDIMNKGLEYPNSSNLVYDFDRYDYWRPWQQMDIMFNKRINPSDTYYADGHFSVSTSNYKSLLNFTTIASVYPKRCDNKNEHICYSTELSGTALMGKKNIRTIDLLPLESNKKGFEYRRSNGRIAGKNLLQMFNEIPNRSVNDTLFIVAHSMGYAYSLGILDVLRGKINFGGFYILAPENAKSGKVNVGEWEEVWQYGSRLNMTGYEAPCLQDGVAPQSKVKGLKKSNVIYFPDKLYNQKGFFNSHFVGYYNWLFSIPKGKPGHINQH